MNLSTVDIIIGSVNIVLAGACYPLHKNMVIAFLNLGVGAACIMLGVATL